MLPLTRAVPGAVAELLRSAPLSPGKIAFAWSAAVGPAVQRASAVRLEGDVLLVDAVSQPWADEIARSSALILKRVQALVGAGVVKRIEIRRA